MGYITFMVQMEPGRSNAAMLQATQVHGRAVPGPCGRHHRMLTDANGVWRSLHVGRID